MDQNGLQRLIGSHFIMGFRGTSVTPHVRQLIEEYHVGAILLASQNLSSAEQATTLVKELQQTAFNAGYEYPLLIAIDQENGGVNAIFDKLHIRQFPSALGLVASDSLELAQSVATATAKELSCLGVNWITGPLLDVLSNSSTQPLGVRSMGDDPQTVAQFGDEFLKGYHAGGLATCGKHFPSYGNLEFRGTPSEIPIVAETRDQLRLSGLVPFEKAIRGGLDSMLVGACSMPHFTDTPITHACLSKSVITDLLRTELGFSGVVISDCLEIEALYDTIGVGQATVMGINAGCDMLMVCSSLSSQIEAMSGLRMALAHGMISKETLNMSEARIKRLKSTYTSWNKALNPLGVPGLESLQQKHQEISQRAYEASISLVRDQSSWIPLSSKTTGKDLVLLTPLVDPLPTAHGTVPKSFRYLKGEDTFRELGLMIAQAWPGKVRHTSYTASGIRPLHEDLISEASAVILLTADCGRNVYQYAFTKYVTALCKMSVSPEMPHGKPLIVVAVSSPYDFVRDSTIGTYLCTYDFTTNAFSCLVQVIFGNLKPTGYVVGTRPRAKLLSRVSKLDKPHQKWLVENFNYARDQEALQQLFKKLRNIPVGESGLPSFIKDTDMLFLSSTDFIDCNYIIVRNSSTGALYGFCTLYVIKSIRRGSIGCIFVDPERRRVGIAQSLHFRAMKYFRDHSFVNEIQYGSDFPGILLGIQVNASLDLSHLVKWVKQSNAAEQVREAKTVIYEIPILDKPNQVYENYKSLEIDDFRFEMIQNHSIATAGSITEYALKYQPRQPTRSLLAMPSILSMLYSWALKEQNSCYIFTMRDIQTSKLCGLALLYESTSQIAKFLPITSQDTGSISSIIVEEGVNTLVYMRILVIMALTQARVRELSKVQMRIVDDHPPASLFQKLGFEPVDEYLSLICNCDDRGTISFSG